MKILEKMLLWFW